jgi:hypothetical protein
VGRGAQSWPLVQNRLNHTAPGAFHQLEPRHDTAVDCRLFDGPHLLCGEKFGHFSGTFSQIA